MLRRYLFLLVILSGPLFFVHRIHGDEGIIWGPVDFKIGASLVNHSIQRFMVMDPGEGVLVVKNFHKGFRALSRRWRI